MEDINEKTEKIDDTFIFSFVRMNPPNSRTFIFNQNNDF